MSSQCVAGFGVTQHLTKQTPRNGPILGTWAVEDSHVFHIRLVTYTLRLQRDVQNASSFLTKKKRENYILPLKYGTVFNLTVMTFFFFFFQNVIIPNFQVKKKIKIIKN
jgi:hypothetical protein